MTFTIFSADCIGNPSNCSYPHKCEITNATSLANAVAHDYVCAEYKGSYRSNDNFLNSDCLPMECDNDHSDDPRDWKTPADIASAFPGVFFAVHYSRNHMKAKNGRSARPKFHVLFAIDRMDDATAYSNLKKLVNAIFPYFDAKALDAARFFFGTANPEVELYPGELTLTEFLNTKDFDADMPQGSYGEAPPIREGSRNATMSRFAGRVLKKYGDCDKAYQAFLEESGKCVPPLEEQELSTIWHSAQGFYKKIAQSPDYIPPDKYGTNCDITAWEAPLPFGEENLPIFPVDALPCTLRDYANAVAQSTQTPVDMAATACLTVASACMRNLYKVEGKADWHEPTNLYSVIIAEPSERKSAIISLATKPVDAFVREYNDKHKVDIEMSKAVKQRLENKKNSLIAQSRKKGEDSAAEDFNDSLRTVVEQLVNFEEKKPLKVYVDDTTPEKLTETLADNGGAFSIISSEGGIFDVLSGTYSSKVNIDVFLKAYSGETISVERIMRPSVSVEEACLTILLSVQPIVIGELMGNKKFRHRGLTARFLYAQPRSFVGSRSLDSSPIPDAAYTAYKAIIQNILAEKKNGAPQIITPTGDAKAYLTAYYDSVEKMLGGELTMYADWLGKLVGNTLRIAGILARCGVMKRNVADAILEEDPSIVIDRATMENAVRIGKYFLVHAINAYGDMGIRSGFKAAAMVIDKLRKQNMTTVNRRDIMRTCRFVSSAEEAQTILEYLEDYGYVRLSSVDASDKLRGGRPKNASYTINPLVK